MGNIYTKLKQALAQVIDTHGLQDETVMVNCKALTAKQAIGEPSQDDYPIIKGRESIVEANFRGSKGHAFSDAFHNETFKLQQALNFSLETNAQRASFISTLNAVYCYFNLCRATVHCKNDEPERCADILLEKIQMPDHVLVVGFQPRFIERLCRKYHVRAVDLDHDNIGKSINNVVIESVMHTDEALQWCDIVFATGSTLVNGTITRFLNQPKPVVFYGVSIAAAAEILGLNRYCELGH